MYTTRLVPFRAFPLFPSSSNLQLSHNEKGRHITCKLIVKLAFDKSLKVKRKQCFGWFVNELLMDYVRISPSKLLLDSTRTQSKKWKGTESNVASGQNSQKETAHITHKIYTYLSLIGLADHPSGFLGVAFVIKQLVQI